MVGAVFRVEEGGATDCAAGVLVYEFGGSVLLLFAFVFGKMDAVGIVGNLFPAFVAGYNLYLDTTHQRRAGGAEA